MDFDPARWMENLAPEVPVIDSYIPGSHDASAYPMGSSSDDFKRALGAVTQATNYTGQLRSGGSRYFDMRITRGNATGDLYMKHSDVKFEPFADVLDEFIDFIAAHPTETVFMDFDFTGNIENEVMDMLLKKFVGGSRFTSKHVVTGPDGNSSYNTALTWGLLAAEAKAGRNFVIIWPAYHKPTTFQIWAPDADVIRYDPYGDFNKKSPQQIVNFLTKSLSNWDKRKLMLTQLINTPFISPLSHPDKKDRDAAPVFNAWLMSHGPGSKLNVVKRDFVTSTWNEGAIAYLIKLNKWTSAGRIPRPPLGDPVHYSDWVRLRSEDGRYLEVHVVPLGTGKKCVARTSKTPTADTNFILREKRYSPGWGLPYSGNPQADSIGANGNIRLVHVDTRVGGIAGDSTVLSQDMNRDSQIYWGVGWDPADNWETFLPYNPDNIYDTSQIHYGSRFFLRSLEKRFWRIVYGDGADADDLIFANSNQNEATVWQFEKGSDPRIH